MKSISSCPLLPRLVLTLAPSTELLIVTCIGAACGMFVLPAELIADRIAATPGCKLKPV
jgi:hypothetical protein